MTLVIDPEKQSSPGRSGGGMGQAGERAEAKALGGNKLGIVETQKSG